MTSVALLDNNHSHNGAAETARGWHRVPGEQRRNREDEGGGGGRNKKVRQCMGMSTGVLGLNL